MTENTKVVTIYTDGGCEPNPGIGGWAAVLLYNGARKEIAGGERESTNNRMELTAAIQALESLTRPCKVELHTDSNYVRLGLTEWLPKWKRNGWKRGKSGEVKNLDLWQRLEQAAARHEVRWSWVPGHRGVVENERCDELAGAEIRKLRHADF